MKHSKRLAWQHGTTGIFAEVVLEVEHIPGQQYHVATNECIDLRWMNAIHFGAACFVESFSCFRREVGECAISVHSVRAVPGDTTVCSLAYVTFHSLCAAFNLDGGDRFLFDTMTGAFRLNTLPPDMFHPL
jgi:hypothetical protein